MTNKPPETSLSKKKKHPAQYTSPSQRALCKRRSEKSKRQRPETEGDAETGADAEPVTERKLPEGALPFSPLRVLPTSNGRFSTASSVSSPTPSCLIDLEVGISFFPLAL